LDTIPSPTAEQVKSLYERTSVAQIEWSKTSFEERRAVLRSLLNFILENQEAICQVGCRDTGKTSKA
jgi:acyl-CoA reductase-like NAD-dependent aldehyde dehydrogenase